MENRAAAVRTEPPVNTISTVRYALVFGDGPNTVKIFGGNDRVRCVTGSTNSATIATVAMHSRLGTGSRDIP